MQKEFICLQDLIKQNTIKAEFADSESLKCLIQYALRSMNCWPGLGIDQADLWVPDSQRGTLTGHLQSRHLFTSEYTGALCLASLIWTQCSAMLSLFFHLCKSQQNPQGLGNKVLVTSPQKGTLKSWCLQLCLKSGLQYLLPLQSGQCVCAHTD